MSHEEMIMKQKEMARAHNAAVLILKKEVELSKKCELLSCKIKAKQVPMLEEDDMEVEVVLDLSVPTISGYEQYSEEVFTKCLDLINQELATMGNSVAMEILWSRLLRVCWGNIRLCSKE